MRLTSPLQHVTRFWWGKGWGPKPRKDTDLFYYRQQWAAKRKRPLQVIEQTLPEGAVPIDPNAYLKEELAREISGGMPEFKRPWPYSNRPVKGSPDDPNYQAQEAFLYKRNKRLIEPINLPLNFTNAILENGLPETIEKLRENVQIDDQFVELCKRRINWCLNNDSAMRKLPKKREFPYLDQNPPRVFGVTENRKENNLLHSLYNISSEWMATKYGFSSEVIRQKVSNPHCILPLNRNDKFVLLDLECDFVTILSNVNDNAKVPKVAEFDLNFAESTSNQSLNSIHPISWEVGFDKRNFYNTTYDFQIPEGSSIQSIFLSQNYLRNSNIDDFKGRGIMFCYGFAVQQAKLKHQTDDIGQIVLDKPITISCIYSNPTLFNVGFVLFQLNTLKPDDKAVRNQVWISEPNSVNDSLKEVITDVVVLQSLGIYN